MLPFSQQLEILMELRKSIEKPPYTPADVARATGISLQTLLNLLDGKSSSPRLATARQLCDCFEITLDYFGCTTIEECQTYLMQHWLADASEPVRSIADAAGGISPRGQRNILSIIEWLRRSTP